MFHTNLNFLDPNVLDPTLGFFDGKNRDLSQPWTLVS